MRDCEGRLFRNRLRTLLGIGGIPDALENEKRVTQLTLDFLKGLAKADPIVAIRMRQHIPAEDGDSHH